MIASDHDRSLNFSGFHEMVDAFSEQCSLAVTEPADTGGQTLKANFLAGEMDPSVQDLVFGEKLENEVVGDFDIVWDFQRVRPNGMGLGLPRTSGGCMRE